MTACKTYATLFILCIVLMTPLNTTSAADSQPDHQPRVGVQLWSVSDAVKANFEGTLTQLANMGFQGVELAGEFGPYANDPEGLADFVAELGMSITSAHVGLDQFDEEQLDNTLAYYKAAGVAALIVPWDERAWHPDRVDELITRLNTLSVILAEHNMQIGYHNHAQEFGAFAEATFWDHIATHTRAEVILQLDVGWARLAGADPIEYVQRYPGRTLSTHYKIRIPEGDTDLSPIIGGNNFDWRALRDANAAVGGTQWLIVEQEQYPQGMTALHAVAASRQGLDALLAKAAKR